MFSDIVGLVEIIRAPTMADSLGKNRNFASTILDDERRLRTVEGARNCHERTRTLHVHNEPFVWDQWDTHTHCCTEVRDFAHAQTPRYALLARSCRSCLAFYFSLLQCDWLLKRRRVSRYLTCRTLCRRILQTPEEFDTNAIYQDIMKIENAYI